jgi:hypothetical protein
MKANAALKEKVRSRANGCCEYCFSQFKYSPDPFSVEHIIPVSKGGSDEMDNLAYSCQGCNNKKYNHIQFKDLITGAFANLYNPRLDVWEEHFRWNEDFSLILGISPTGRATVSLLDLNREGVTNLRALLYLIAQHPPF